MRWQGQQQKQGTQLNLENTDVNRNDLTGADSGMQQPTLQLLPQAGNYNAVLICAGKCGS
jgi:hypothetical protein